MNAGGQQSRLKVTLVIGSLDVGGAERQLVRLANGLDRGVFEVSVLYWSGSDELLPELAGHVAVQRLRVPGAGLPAALRRPFTAAWLLLSLSRALRRARPDIVHAYLLAAYVVAALSARLAGIPVVVAGRRGLTTYSTYGLIGPIIGRFANHLIALHLCNSEAARRFACEKEGIPATRTRVIRNGIPLSGGAAPRDLPVTRRRGELLAAMIANLIAYKGHQVLFEAVALLPQEGGPFRVVLFGEGPERARLEREQAHLGLQDAIVFAGRRPDAAALLPAFDITLLASLEESLPNTVMESMAAGVPVVASDVGGVGELIVDGEHGRLVPPGDPAALAAAISWMRDHPRERARMGRAAQERVRREFSVESMVAATEAVYLELAAAAHPETARLAR